MNFTKDEEYTHNIVRFLIEGIIKYEIVDNKNNIHELNKCITYIIDKILLKKKYIKKPFKKERIYEIIKLNIMNFINMELLIKPKMKSKLDKKILLNISKIYTLL
jgi:hypothetical protein